MFAWCSVSLTLEASSVTAAEPSRNQHPVSVSIAKKCWRCDDDVPSYPLNKLMHTCVESVGFDPTFKNCATVELLVEYNFRFRCQSGSSVSRISHSIDTQLLHPVQLFLNWAPSWAKVKHKTTTVVYNRITLLTKAIYSIDEMSFSHVKHSFMGVCTAPHSVKATEIEALPTVSMPSAFKEKNNTLLRVFVCNITFGGWLRLSRASADHRRLSSNSEA